MLSRTSNEGHQIVKETDAAAERPRVLVVDDEPLMGATLEVTLGDDYEVILARSVDEARRLLVDDRSVDVVLCDLMMPKESGWHLHSWVLSNRPALADRMIFETGIIGMQI